MLCLGDVYAAESKAAMASMSTPLLSTMPATFLAWRYCVKKFYRDYSRALRVFPALNPGRCDYIDCNNVRWGTQGVVLLFVSKVYAAGDCTWVVGKLSLSSAWSVRSAVVFGHRADCGSIPLCANEPDHDVSPHGRRC